MVKDVEGEWLTGCVTEAVDGLGSEGLRKKEIKEAEG